MTLIPHRHTDTIASILMYLAIKLTVSLGLVLGKHFPQIPLPQPRDEQRKDAVTLIACVILEDLVPHQEQTHALATQL